MKLISHLPEVLQDLLVKDFPFKNVTPPAQDVTLTVQPTDLWWNERNWTTWMEQVNTILVKTLLQYWLAHHGLYLVKRSSNMVAKDTLFSYKYVYV